MVLKKLLNLITGKVSHPKHDTNHQVLENIPRLHDQFQRSVSKSIKRSITPVSRNSIIIENVPGTPENYYFGMFIPVYYTCTVNRMTLSPLSHIKTFMETLQKCMPHWTSICKDKITYATITVALSHSCVDVESYLIKLKKKSTHWELNFQQR